MFVIQSLISLQSFLAGKAYGTFRRRSARGAWPLHGKGTCPVARKLPTPVVPLSPMEAFASIGFFMSTQHTRGRLGAPCERRAASCALATTAMSVRYGIHLLAALRPAPADVNRYVGQGDRTLLAQNLDASATCVYLVATRGDGIPHHHNGGGCVLTDIFPSHGTPI